MRILLVAHSTYTGGAENAFINLVSHVQALGHQPVVMCPAKDGPSFQRFVQMNLEWIVFSMPWAAPLPASAFAALTSRAMDDAETLLRERKIELVISNTLVLLHGAILAARLGVPHVAWAHELLDADPLLATVGLPSRAYQSVVAELNDHVLCCSNTVLRRVLDDLPAEKASVLYPHLAEATARHDPGDPHDDRLQLLFIGVLQRRKNAKFAIAVLLALRQRGCDASLELFGAAQDQSPFLHRQVERYGLQQHVTFHGVKPNWRNYARGKSINLVCATVEPFAMTMPEALEVGIPVVSSRCGGPEEFLPSNLLYDRDDLDTAVRTIERVANNYADYVQMALDIYGGAAKGFSAGFQREVVRSALVAAVAAYRPKALNELYLGPGFGNALHLTALPRPKLAENIARACGVDQAAVDIGVARAKTNAGASLSADCRAFDVVPFAHSDALQNFRNNSVALVYEHAARLEMPAQLQVAAFLMTSLLHLRSIRQPHLKVLVVGDALGFNSMRMAAGGSDVHYLIEGRSVSESIAAANFSTFLSSSPPGCGSIQQVDRSRLESRYDALVYLELLNHENDLASCLTFFSTLINEEGLAFFSDGAEPDGNRNATRLWKNEAYRGRLPELAATVGLHMVEGNLAPYGEPLVFSKRKKISPNQGDTVSSFRSFIFTLEIARHMGYL